MYYFKHKTDLLWGIIPKNYKTITKAKEYVKAHIVICNNKFKIEDYLIFSKEELENWKKERENKALDKLSVSAKQVLKVLGEFNEEIEIDEIIENYGLSNNTDAPYYAYCYWDGGGNGSFSSLEELCALYEDQAARDDGDGFDIDVYRITNNGKNVKKINVQPQITVELFCNGKKLT